MTKKDEEKPDSTHLDDEAFFNDMRLYVSVYNEFQKFVETMEWPDEIDINCMDTRNHLFQTYWQQALRQRLNSHHYEHQLERQKRKKSHAKSFRFQLDEKEFKHRFFTEFFQHKDSNQTDESSTIDPSDHQPTDKHMDDASKSRRKRFRDEWR